MNKRDHFVESVDGREVFARKRRGYRPISGSVMDTEFLAAPSKGSSGGDVSIDLDTAEAADQKRSKYGSAQVPIDY